MKIYYLVLNDDHRVFSTSTKYYFVENDVLYFVNDDFEAERSKGVVGEMKEFVKIGGAVEVTDAEIALKFGVLF